MRSVGRGDMVAAQQIARIDEIDVFVGLHAVADLRFGGGLLLAFEFLNPGAEVAGFAPDGLQENQRRGGMRAADGIDESVETFVDDLGAGIRETVEDEGVGFDAGQIRCEFGLHGALSAESQIDAVKSRVASETRRIGHACASGRDSVRNARTVDDDLVAEGIFHRGDDALFIDADFELLQLVVKRQIEQALLFALRHIADYCGVVAVVLAVDLRSADSGEDPLSVAADVEVQPFLCDGGHVVARIFARCLPAGADRAAVGAEHDGQSRRVVAVAGCLCGHPEAGGVDAVVGLFGGKRLADDGQRRGVHVADGVCGAGCRCGKQATEQQKQG